MLDEAGTTVKKQKKCVLDVDGADIAPSKLATTAALRERHRRIDAETPEAACIDIPHQLEGLSNVPCSNFSTNMKMQHMLQQN